MSNSAIKITLDSEVRQQLQNATKPYTDKMQYHQSIGIYGTSNFNYSTINVACVLILLYRGGGSELKVGHKLLRAGKIFWVPHFSSVPPVWGTFRNKVSVIP